MTERFDPNKHLRVLKGKGGSADYLDVKWRLVWLRSEHPDAVSTVEHVEISPDIAIFKATVSIPGKGSATDYGSETPRDFGDYIEKAATKALGRALAQLGYGTQFVGFELDENTRIVDGPVDRKPEDDDGHAAAQPRRQPADESAYPPQGRTLDEALNSGISPVDRPRTARQPRTAPHSSSAPRPAAALTAAGTPKRSLAEVMRELAPLAKQVRTNDDALSNDEYARYHALEAEAQALYTGLLDTIRDDEADPKARRMALHQFYDSADTPARLSQRVEAVKQSGLPSDDLDKAYQYHHKRLAEQLAPPASIAG